MNEFLNHLIAQNTVFIQLEKESSIYVFRFLQNQGVQNVMYKPGKKDFNLYWAKDCVIVTDMISEAPFLSNELIFPPKSNIIGRNWNSLDEGSISKMSEKDKMLHQKLYDANYDKELERERIQCKILCQKYNNLAIDNIDERHEFIKSIIGETGKNVHIEPDFWCDYGYRIKVGENFYANHGLVILDAGGVTFGHDVFIAPSCGFHTSGHPIDFERRNRGLEYAYPIVVGDNVWIGAGVQVMPGVTIGSNVVIGGGSTVVKDIPSNSVAVGNPCKVIRQITDDDAKKSWDR